MAIVLRSVKGSNLTAAEVDGNFIDLDGRVTDLETNPPQANGIASITQSGSVLTVTYDDASQDTFNLPVAGWVWKGQWSASAFANGEAWPAGSVFAVTGLGVYLTLIGHSTVTPFDPDRQIGGANVYAQVFGDSGTPWDFGFSMAAAPGAGEIIQDVPVTRAITIPANLAGAVGICRTAPEAQYAIDVQDDGVSIGTITVTPTTGGADITFATASGTQKAVAAGSIVSFVAPNQGTAQDTTIAGLAVTLKAQVAA